MNNSDINKEKLLDLIKIVESNLKLINLYKNIIKKIDTMESNISQKFEDKEEENKFIKNIVDTSNDYYYRISKNCLT